MRRRLVLLAVWAAGAAVAVALSMWAVGLVGGRISGRDSTVVSQRDVEQALAASPTVASTAPDSTEPAPEPAAPPGSLAAGGASRTEEAPPTSAAAAPPVAEAPAPVPVTSAPTGQEAVYTTAGGTVAVRCSGATISLLYATPSPGWQLHGSATTGPTEVDVRFEPASDAKGREVRVRVRCEGGTPIDEIRSDG